MRPYNINKFAFRTKKGIFLGYSQDHLGYKCLDLETNKIYMARHVHFNEINFPFILSNLTCQSRVQQDQVPWLTVLVNFRHDQQSSVQPSATTYTSQVTSSSLNTNPSNSVSLASTNNVNQGHDKQMVAYNPEGIYLCVDLTKPAKQAT